MHCAANPKRRKPQRPRLRADRHGNNAPGEAIFARAAWSGDRVGAVSVQPCSAIASRSQIAHLRQCRDDRIGTGSAWVHRRDRDADQRLRHWSGIGGAAGRERSRHRRRLHHHHNRSAGTLAGRRGAFAAVARIGCAGSRARTHWPPWRLIVAVEGCLHGAFKRRSLRLGIEQQGRDKGCAKGIEKHG